MFFYNLFISIIFFVDAILIGGLDIRPGDKNINEQINLLKIGFGEEKIVKGFRYNSNISVIEETVKSNPNAYIFLFSAGCSKAEILSQFNFIDKNKIVIIEPYIKSYKTKKIIINSIINGVPSENVFYGSGAERGEGIIGANSSNSKTHWGALTSVGKKYHNK